MKSRRWFQVILAIGIIFILLSGCKKQQRQVNIPNVSNIDEPQNLPSDVDTQKDEIKSTPYQYTNLVTTDSIDEFKTILQDTGVPQEDIEAVLEYIQIYHNEATTAGYLSQGWSSASIEKDLYDYSSVINAYTLNPFKDINCRQAAYLIYHSFFETKEKVELPQQNTELSALNLNINENSSKYETLFGSIASDKPLHEVLTEHWNATGSTFHDTIQLVSLWGRKDGHIIHMHCGILIQINDQNFFFEKTDPLLPYQFSRFTSTDTLNEYLLKRSDEYDDMTVSMNDRIQN